jgi:hypothetical protein
MRVRIHKLYVRKHINIWCFRYALTQSNYNPVDINSNEEQESIDKKM